MGGGFKEMGGGYNKRGWEHNIRDEIRIVLKHSQ